MRRQITDIHELLNANRSSPSFIRVIHYSGEFEQTLIQLYEKARQNGVIIEGRIPNPTDSNLSYYYETMGQDFYMEDDGDQFGYAIDWNGYYDDFYVAAGF